MLAQVSPLNAQDLEAVVALDQHIFGGWWTLPGYQQELTRSSSSLLGLRLNFTAPAHPSQTATPCPLIGVGCLWRVLDEAHITMLGVHPQYQGRGLGNILLIALLRTAQWHQTHRATLEVRASNTKAIALYQKFGFQIAGQRPQYYDNGEDALILWRSKLQTPQFSDALDGWERKTEHRLATWGCQGVQVILDDMSRNA